MLDGVYRVFLVIVASLSKSSFCRLISSPLCLYLSIYGCAFVACWCFRVHFFGWRGVIVAFRVFIMLSMTTTQELAAEAEAAAAATASRASNHVDCCQSWRSANFL